MHKKHITKSTRAVFQAFCLIIVIICLTCLYHYVINVDRQWHASAGVMKPKFGRVQALRRDSQDSPQSQAPAIVVCTMLKNIIGIYCIVFHWLLVMNSTESVCVHHTWHIHPLFACIIMLKMLQCCMLVSCCLIASVLKCYCKPEHLQMKVWQHDEGPEMPAFGSET